MVTSAEKGFNSESLTGFLVLNVLGLFMLWIYLPIPLLH